MDGDGIDVGPHGPASQIHERKEDLRALVVSSLRGASSRVPESLLALFLPGGRMPEAVKRFKLHNLMRVSVGRNHIVDRENLESVPAADIRHHGIFELRLVE